MNTTYQTLIVKFSEPITALDGIFDDTGAWGTDTLKGWIDDYESTRFRHRQPYGSHHERVQYGMCERVATTADPHFRNARILNGMAVSAPPILKTLKTKDMIAKTILQQIGGKRFTAMTGSRDFIDMGNGLRMSLARNKTSANRLDIIYDEGADLYNMRFYLQDVQQKDL